MASTLVRVVGSGYTTFLYQGTSIAFAEGVEDSGQRAFSDLGQPYQFIQPLGSEYPVEIATSRVLAGGTLMLTIRELWAAPVWWQLVGLAGTLNIVDVFKKLAQNPSYVTCQTIIKPPGTENNSAGWRGKIYHNCYSGDVRYLTAQGTKTLAETAGTTQLVLGHRGHWTPAEIRSFGEQEVMRVTITRQGREKELLATPGHRWFAEGRRPQKCYSREVITSELVPGDKLVSVHRVGQTSKIRPSAVGIQAGIVYGDGNVEGKARNVSGVSLFGEKDSELLKWFPHSPTRVVSSGAGVAGIRVVDLPMFFKAAPPLREGLSYLYGWLAGYFAADGCVDKNGSASVSSASLESLRLAQDVCHLLGVRTLGISTASRSGFAGREPSDLYRMVIYVPDLTEDFFLLGEHRSRASHRLSENAKGIPGWTVKSVENTGQSEEVFCAIVPDGQAFALEDNILTGNCVVVDINDGDTITVGALAVTKGITIAYTHSTGLNT